MRKLLMTLALVGLLSVPIMAQFRPGMFGGGPMGGDMLLMNKSVQTELKFDDKQKKALGEITKKQADARGKIREAFEDGDREKAMELVKKSGEETAKSLKEFKKTLTTAQTKRLHEIEVQVATRFNDLNIFKNEAVAKALKLTDKQKAAAKEAATDLAKDTKELFDDAKGDFTKFRAIQKKVAGLRKDAFEKFTKGLSTDQQKVWKDLAGEKFDLKMEGGFGKGKGKNRKPKTDEF
jgi:hypothetical protein